MVPAPAMAAATTETGRATAAMMPAAEAARTPMVSTTATEADRAAAAMTATATATSAAAPEPPATTAEAARSARTWGPGSLVRPAAESWTAEDQESARIPRPPESSAGRGREPLDDRRELRCQRLDPVVNRVELFTRPREPRASLSELGRGAGKRLRQRRDIDRRLDRCRLEAVCRYP